MESVRGILSPQEYKKPANRVLYWIFLLVCIVCALIMIYPIFWVLMSAMKSPSEIFRSPPSVFPDVFQIDNFVQAWGTYQIPKMYLNTFLVYIGFMASRLLVLTSASYALSKLRLPFRQFFYLMFLSTLILPTFAYIIPSYLVIQQMGLFDSWWALWLPAGASSLQLLLMKGFFDEIPNELLEAARMDGAGSIRILKDVILPNAKPIIAVVCIFSFLEVWNNFFFPHLIITTPDKWTMPIMLWYRSFTIGGNPPMNIQLAGMFITMIPPLVLFIFFQKYITEGVTLSGIKG